MDAGVQVVYEIAGFRLDAERHTLTAADGRPIPLTAKAFETLLYMVRHRERLLEKATLMRDLWPGVIVEENSLNQVITTLRRAFGERRGEDRFIVTVPGRGYRFVAEVREVGAARAPPVEPSATGRPPSIAVLSFVNLTNDPEKEYFGEGMAEELIHMLTRIPGLKVSARTSSFAYKGRHTDVRDIGRDLGVAAVIEGSVRSAGERIRVTVQLVETQAGYHLWSQTFDRKFEDIFALQDELAAAVVRELPGRAEHLARPPVPSAPPTRNVEAYQSYLQGSAFLGRPSEPNLRTAIMHFENAIARDPLFARALCAEANAHAMLATMFGTKDLSDTLTQAQRAAEQALALDPSLADAEAMLGAVQAHRANWLEAEAHRARARSLGANDVALGSGWAHSAAVGHLRQRFQEAAIAHERAPAEPATSMLLGSFYALLGRDAEAQTYLDLAVTLGWGENLVPIPIIRSEIARRAGRFKEAANYMMRALPADSRRAGAEPLVEPVYAALADPARKPAALAAIRELFNTREAEITAAASLPMVLIHWLVLLGDLDMAHHVAARAVNHFLRERAIRLNSFLPQLWIPELRAFRQDPRFGLLAERLGLIEYWKKYGPPDECEIREGRLICR